MRVPPRFSDLASFIRAHAAPTCRFARVPQAGAAVVSAYSRQRQRLAVSARNALRSCLFHQAASARVMHVLFLVVQTVFSVSTRGHRCRRQQLCCSETRHPPYSEKAASASSHVPVCQWCSRSTALPKLQACSGDGPTVLLLLLLLTPPLHLVQKLNRFAQRQSQRNNLNTPRININGRTHPGQAMRCIATQSRITEVRHTM